MPTALDPFNTALLAATPAPSAFSRLLTRAINDADHRITSQHLIAAAEADSKDQHGMRVWTTVAGKLSAVIDMMSSELNRMRGHNITPQAGAHTLRTNLGDADVLIEYEYDAGTPSQTSGPPERCYEGDPEELTILGVLVNGKWIDTDEIAPATIERWEEAVRDHMQDLRDDDLSDMAEARAADREFA